MEGSGVTILRTCAYRELQAVIIGPDDLESTMQLFIFPYRLPHWPALLKEGSFVSARHTYRTFTVLPSNRQPSLRSPMPSTAPSMKGNQGKKMKQQKAKKAKKAKKDFRLLL